MDARSIDHSSIRGETMKTTTLWVYVACAAWALAACGDDDGNLTGDDTTPATTETVAGTTAETGSTGGDDDAGADDDSPADGGDGGNVTDDGEENDDSRADTGPASDTGSSTETGGSGDTGTATETTGTANTDGTIGTDGTDGSAGTDGTGSTGDTGAETGTETGTAGDTGAGTDTGTTSVTLEVCDLADNDNDTVTDDVKGCEGGFDGLVTTPGDDVDVPPTSVGGFATLTIRIRDVLTTAKMLTNTATCAATLDYSIAMNIELDFDKLIPDATCKVDIALSETATWQDNLYPGAKIGGTFCCAGLSATTVNIPDSDTKVTCTNKSYEKSVLDEIKKFVAGLANTIKDCG
jgi:hypothetical protein